MKSDIPKYIQIRSFLFANVQLILDNMNAKRQANKIEADDLFGSDEVYSSYGASFNYQFPVKAKFDVLSEEKNSLGLYISGNPLESYLPVLEWVREASRYDDIHLILVEKNRKIFTKSGGMMLALQITTPFEEIEGLIFPKIALKFSNIVEENKIYWCFGSIKRKVKKDVEEESEDGIKEFDEKPKLLINSIVPFEDGVNSLISDLDLTISDTRKDILNSLNYHTLLLEPEKFATSGDIAESDGSAKQQQNIAPKLLIFRKQLGTSKLIELKSLLKNNLVSGGLLVNLELETKEGYKKVKGNFWIEKKDLAKFKDYIE